MLNEKSLKEKYPEIAAMWHPTRNGNLTPDRVSCNSMQKVWWIDKYDDELSGKHYEFEWEQTVCHLVRSGRCPFLKG